MTSPYDTGRFADVPKSDIDLVASHIDAARIVERMLADSRAHPQEWENATLERFLDALSRSIRGLDGLYLNRGELFPAQPTWKLVTEALMMASGYE